jgi:hypothetical protein
MATLAIPTIELLMAMEELGLSGWMPGNRVRVRVRREGSAAERRVNTTTRAGLERRAHAELVPTLGLALVAASVTAIALRGESESRVHSRDGGAIGALVRGIAGVFLPRRERAVASSALRHAAVVALCGIGAFATTVALAANRARTRKSR